MSTALTIGDVLSDNQYDVGIARLLIVARQAFMIFQAMTYIPGDSPHLLEYRTILIGIYASLLKELVDALDNLKAQGVLARITSKKNTLTDLRDDALTAMKYLNKDDPASLYSSFLKRVRNCAGFHIINGPLGKAIAELKDAPLIPTIYGDDKQRIDSLPIVTQLLSHMSFVDVDLVPQLLSDAGTLQDAASRVAIDLYLINVRIAEGKQ